MYPSRHKETHAARQPLLFPFHFTRLFCFRSPPPKTSRTHKVNRLKPPHTPGSFFISFLFFIFTLLLSPRHDTPRPNEVISVPCKERLSISAPGQRDALRFPALFPDGDEFRFEFVHLGLLLEVKDDDGGCGGGAQPVTVGREYERVDLVAGIEGVELLGLVDVPQHGGTVLAAGSAQGAVGRDSHGVDVARVSNVVGLDAARGEFPNLRTFRFRSAVWTRGAKE